MTLEKAEASHSAPFWDLLLGVNFEDSALSLAFFSSVCMNHPTSEHSVSGYLSHSTGQQKAVALLPNLSPKENEK